MQDIPGPDKKALSSSEKRILDCLSASAAKCAVVEIHYKKAALDQESPRRLIEPYSLSQGKQDLMLRAYQLDPETGWRFFMLHKISDIKEHGSSFKPKRKETISKGIFAKTFEPFGSWTKTTEEYRDHVLSALADKTLSESEREFLGGFRKSHGITVEQMRNVHATIFSNCLNHILTDGAITDDEEKHLSGVNSCLIKCGWGIS